MSHTTATLAVHCYLVESWRAALGSAAQTETTFSKWPDSAAAVVAAGVGGGQVLIAMLAPVDDQQSVVYTSTW